jgi:sugar/nucleoside kinase (ribokinase family)
MDLLYPEVDFSSPAFRSAASMREGDGGLAPGRLVFARDAERFARKPFAQTLAELVGPGPDGSPRAPAAENVGGPSVVSLVHAAQMLEDEGIAVSYRGATGDDAIGGRLRALLARTPLDISGLETRPGRSPSTYVLSDPSWDSGRGERCFVNEVGAAEAYLPAELGEALLGADIVALGGTALVPGLHDGLPGLLAEARRRGALAVVNTVFDFRAERRDGVGPWPLGGPAPSPGAGPGPAASYRCCDLLVMDREEALRLTGARELTRSLRLLESSGVGAFAITRGGESVLAWAGRGRFGPMALREFPVSERAGRRLSGGRRGDTTGCGDAFAGGVIAALGLQMKAGAGELDLADAIAWGIAAGAFTLGILGGTYYESRPGEKRELVSSYREDWLAQPRS